MVCRFISPFCYLLVIFITASANQSPAQSLNLRNYDPRSGLSSSETYYCLQDSKGYIWIASDAGVNRFDGKEFTKFTKADGLADNTIFTIYEDHRHRIWFLSYSGGISYYENGLITTIAGNDQLKKLINYQNEVIVSFEVDRGDTIWLSHNYRQSYFRIPPAGHWKNPVMLTERKGERNFIFRKNSTVPLYTSSSYFSDSGEVKVNTAQGVQSFTIPGNTSDVATYVRLLPIAHGEFIFSIFNHLYHVKNGQLAAYKKFSNRIISICSDRTGNLWVGVYQQGAFRFNGRRLDSTPTNYLGNISVTHVLEDHEHGFWFTTLEKGLFYTPSILIRHLELPTREESVSALGAGPQKLYAGSINGQVVEITPAILPGAANTFTVSDSFEAAKNHLVSSITPFGSELLINVGRLFRFGKNGRSPRLFLVDGQHIGTRNIYVTEDSTLLLPTLYTLLHTDREGRLLRKDSFPSRLTRVYKQKEGRIYVGCMNGLWLVNGGKSTYLGDSIPSLASPVSGMVAGPDGNLWVSTRGGGVTYLSPKKIKVFDNRKQGLSDHCTCLASDQQGYIWAGSNNGLFRIDPAGEEVRRFGVSHGLRTNEIKSIVAFKGHLFIASPQGLDFFRLSENLFREVHPPVHVSSILVNQQRKNFKGEFALPHTENNLEFFFAGFSFKSENHVRYWYRLYGYDKIWTLTQNENARYTNLPPGTYRFELYAENHAGVLSGRPAVVAFTIKAAWWMNPWIIGLAVFMSAFLVGSVIWLVIKRSRARQQKKAQIEQLLIESRLTALRPQMNPHFIFNVINSIQHFILLNDKDKAYDYLARFSRLIRIVLDNSRYTTVSLETEIQLLTLYMDLEKLRFEREFIYEIEVRTIQAPALLSLPNMLLQPYIENAIIHGISPKKGGGAIRILFEEDGEMLRVTITDDGIGRARSRQLRKQSSHRSAGMLITEERIKTLGELMSNRINVSVKDLVDRNGDPAGTQVELLIPVL